MSGVDGSPGKQRSLTGWDAVLWFLSAGAASFYALNPAILGLQRDILFFSFSSLGPRSLLSDPFALVGGLLVGVPALLLGLALFFYDAWLLANVISVPIRALSHFVHWAREVPMANSSARPHRFKGAKFWFEDSRRRQVWFVALAALAGFVVVYWFWLSAQKGSWVAH